MSIEKSQQITSSQMNLSQANNPPVGTVTTSFLVKIGTVFQSASVTGYDNFVDLLWFTSIEKRHSIGTMTSDYQASATLEHSLLEMHILIDSSMPTLRQNLRNNTPIPEIKITRVGHLGAGAENKTLYSTTFTNCFLESLEEFPDKLIVKARINTRSDTAAATDFKGTQQPASGQTSSGWDYPKNMPIS